MTLTSGEIICLLIRKSLLIAYPLSYIKTVSRKILPKNSKNSIHINIFISLLFYSDAS